MLTIAGNGINLYSLEELSKKVNFEEFDYIIADINFDNSKNKSYISANKNIIFLPLNLVKSFIKDKLIEHKKIIYIVTGSPLFYSATGRILTYLKEELSDFDENKVNIIAAQSSKDYLLKKLKIQENKVTSLSLHGRDILSLDLTRFLSTQYTFLLCDEESLHSIYQYTKYLQKNLNIYLGSKLGTEDELIEIINLEELTNSKTIEDIRKRYSPFVVLIEKKYNSENCFSANADFATNAGMLTKTDKRALTLQSLELKPNIVMWDIGAGSGSVSIDAYKVFKVRTYIFEKNIEQCEFIKENLSKHKVAAAKLIEGNALNNLNGISDPDRIFIGGGGEEVLLRLVNFYEILKENGILVANIVGLENFAVAIETVKKSELKYDIRSINIANYKKISDTVKLSVAEPDRTLFQLILKK